MAATLASPESADSGLQNAGEGSLTARTARVAAAAAALLVLTNGPVLLFSKSVLDRTGRWEDAAVWPWLLAAAACGGALAAWDLPGARRRRLGAAERIAAAAAGWFALAAVASSLWSVDPTATAWRSSIYAGMALLAWAVARFDVGDTAMTIALVAASAVGASLLLIALRPDLGLDQHGYWKGVYTNRNSLAPLAAVGVLAGVRFVVAPGRARRVAASLLVVGSATGLAGAGSRTAWVALGTAVAVSVVPPACWWLGRRWDRRRAAWACGAAVCAGAAAAAGGLAAIWNEPTLQQRRTIWGLVWDRILDRPLVGHGFFTFWDIEELTQHVLLRRGSAHNSLVEVGLGLGLLGAVPFVAILVLAARNTGLALWRRPGADTWMQAALVALLLVENVTESFVLWFSYSWVLLMAAALRPAPDAATTPLSASALPGPLPGRTARQPGAETPPPFAPTQPEGGDRTGNDPADNIGNDPADNIGNDPAEPELPGGPPRPGAVRAVRRLRSGWTGAVLMALVVLALWLPDASLPLGNSDDGRILAFTALKARNFWDLGPTGSDWGARVDPFVRDSFDAVPRSDPPVEAVTYAHHPPLKDWLAIGSTGLLGESLAALRLPAFIMGASTVLFMASLLRACGLRWGPVLLSLGAMACTGFFYVYGRLGVGFSLLVACTAAVAWLRRTERPSRWALAGAGALAGLTAMQSWIGLAAIGPLAAWLFVSRSEAGQTDERIRHQRAGPWPERPVSTTSKSDNGSAATPRTPTYSRALLRRTRPAAAEPADSPIQPDAERLRTERPARAANESGSGADAARSAPDDAGTLPARLPPPRGWRARGWSPSLTALVVGAAAGAAVTAAWMLAASGLPELVDRFAFRFGNDVATASEQHRFTFGEFLSRQWSFASEELLVPPWLRVLLVPALVAGLVDKRTRVCVAIALAPAAALTFGLQQGAWIHRLWNFPWLAPTTIGLAALLDAARRAVPERLRTAAAAAGGVALAATLLAVTAGGTRDRYISDPADLGEALERAAAAPEARRAELAWTGPGLPTPRWASYYLDVPVWNLEASRLSELQESDLVILRAGRKPDFVPDDAFDDPLAAVGDFRVITAASLSP